MLIIGLAKEKKQQNPWILRGDLWKWVDQLRSRKENQKVGKRFGNEAQKKKINKRQ